jgi:hypothetical protein
MLDRSEHPVLTLAALAGYRCRLLCEVDRRACAVRLYFAAVIAAAAFLIDIESRIDETR